MDGEKKEHCLGKTTMPSGNVFMKAEADMIGAGQGSHYPMGVYERS